MPYIQSNYRDDFDKLVTELIIKISNYPKGTHSGNLNYVISRLVSGVCGPEYNYDAINTAIGVLECAKQELYRRLSCYENFKLISNGDVLELSKFEDFFKEINQLRK